MTCQTCSNWNPKATPRAMAREHFALCNKGPIWDYSPPTAKCNEFKQAAADVVEKRVQWLGKVSQPATKE